ncbi:MAG: AgmX/PglI C-terminal domain-containing protein [Bdellovibrionota bacterium]
MSKAVAISAVEKEKARALRLQAELFEENGQSLGSYVTDGQDKLIIGSSKRADLVVPHTTVSQIHAMLRIMNDDHIVLYDLGSERGTFVDGKKIIERKLAQGEFFQIGDHRVKVNILDLESNQNGTERSLFWAADCGGQPDFLETVLVQGGIVQEERTLAKNGRIVFGRRKSEMIFDGVKAGDRFVYRKDAGGGSTVECFLPPGFKAEIYDGENELVRVIEQEGTAFTFNEKEKARLLSANDVEVMLFWRQQGLRGKRRSADAESPALQRAYLICFTLAALVLLFISYVPLKSQVVEDAVTPTTSYMRTTMGSEAPAAAEKSEAPAAAQAAQQQNQQPASKATSISNSLSKMLNKKSSVSAESIQQAISQNGNQTVRSNVTNSNMKSTEMASGSIGGGGNVNALSAGLASGGGAKAGSLNGFATGKGATVGGAGSFGGKGFSMNLGGDEAEAIGGLDKSLIAAVVQANIGQIKHCYERQLIVDPNIFGKVVAQWTINKDGLVSTTAVKKTTMNNSSVENCILGKIKTWEFPKPKGGGQVVVSYPFLFKSLN